jgi:hypothetical protein
VGVKELERSLVLIPELVCKTCGGSTERSGVVTASQNNLEAMSASTPSHICRIYSLQVQTAAWFLFRSPDFLGPGAECSAIAIRRSLPGVGGPSSHQRHSRDFQVCHLCLPRPTGRNLERKEGRGGLVVDRAGVGPQRAEPCSATARGSTLNAKSSKSTNGPPRSSRTPTSVHDPTFASTSTSTSRKP